MKFTSDSDFPGQSPNAPPFSYPPATDQRLINRRQIWAANRFWMETYHIKTRRYGNKGHHHWYSLLCMMRVFEAVIRLLGFYRRGVRNAKNICLREISFTFPNLPPAFEGFTILHLSDLHLDGLEDLETKILETVGDRTVDLCVFTGDYRTDLHGVNKNIISKLQVLTEGIRSREGFIGVLGNHDDCHMVDPLERINIRMLINASCMIQRENDQIRLIGTDDVHYYYTDQALHALEYAESGFSIALVHSPELYDKAALMGVDLYLCGHTHAGQICLPGGFPIIRHLNRGRKYFRGRWQYQGMQGITNAGAGTSGIPVRFNTRSEVLLHTLKRRPEAP